MKRGLDWYKREPRAIIDSKRKARMTARQAAIFDLVLDLIYEGGGETPDAPQYFAGHFSDIGTASARRTVQELVDMGKLIRVGDMLTNGRAKNEAKTRRKLSETRAEIGRIGGVSSGKSRAKSNENNDSGEANASSKPQAEIEKEIDKTEANASVARENECAVVPFAAEPGPKRKPRAPPKVAIPKDAVPTEQDYAAADRRNLTREEADAQYERFKNHHLANGKLFADWGRAWITWLDSPYFKPVHGQGDRGDEERIRRAAEYARTMF